MAFDLTVHHRDPKSGRITEVTPYVRHANSDGVVYEREGLYYTESGHPASADLVRRVVGKEAKVVEAKADWKTGSKRDHHDD